MYDLPLAVMNFGEAYSHRELLERIRPMVHHIVGRARLLLAQTRHCAESYRLLGLSPAVEVIPIGIDMAPFETLPPQSEAAASFGLPPNGPVVAFLGRMVEDMGLPTLLEAVPSILNRVPDASVLIAGGRGDLTQDAEATAGQWAGRVVVAPDLPDARLAAVYAAAAVVAVPTRSARACGSLTAAEAMGAGRAVVATSVGGIPEYVADGETGRLVPAGHPAALAEAIIGLLGDPGEARRMGDRGRQRAVRLFDTRRTNPRFEAAFRRAAGLP
jgi:glycosyltransferase involved in cell wall biosynthesis